jgi:chemotaxis family two-component system sensor kinase Cph1
LNKEDFTILQVSENTENTLGITPERLLKEPLEQFVKADLLAYIKEQVSRKEITSHLPLFIQWQQPQEKAFSGLLYAKEDYLLLELEPLTTEGTGNSFIQIYQEIGKVVAALKNSSTLEEVNKIVAEELKKLSGFDKVMVYRFNADWNGEVVAEAHEEGLPSYLGLHFPASDVPRQARELYLKTPYRLIPDVYAQAVKLYPVVNPLTNSLTDIAECSLRAVPLVHIEYLRNMGVGASMSTPIVVGGRLWGLISCHHKVPRPISFELRSSFQIIAGILSAQLNTLEKEKSFSYKTALHKIELKLFEQMYSKPTVEEGLLEEPSYLHKLLKVSGLVLVSPGNYETSGQVPDKFFINNLVKWLIRYSREKVFATDALPGLFSSAEKYKDIASGLIAIEINLGKAYLLGFRPEVIKSVSWGGNPNEAINYEKDKTQYHPRNSFKLWKEQVKFTSDPWHTEEGEVANHIRIAILEKMLDVSEKD